MTTMMMNVSAFNERPHSLAYGESSEALPACRLAAHSSSARPSTCFPAKNNKGQTGLSASPVTVKKPACQAILSDVERMALRKDQTHKPGPSKRNRDAATTIQRHFRGHVQRRQFRIQWLQFKIDTVEQRKQAELDEIRREVADRKTKLKEKLTKRYQVERKREQQVDSLYKEAKQIVTYLRKENENLRQKNAKLAEACQNLQLQNNRIVAAQNDVGGIMQELTQRLAQIQATNEYLHKAIPDYKNAIELLENELETRNDYCMAETRIKNKCKSTIINVVHALEDGRARGKLSKDLLGMTLEADAFLATHEEQAPLPEMGHESFRDMGRSQLLKGLGASLAALHYESDDEDDEVDEYVGTVIAF